MVYSKLFFCTIQVSFLIALFKIANRNNVQEERVWADNFSRWCPLRKAHIVECFLQAVGIVAFAHLKKNWKTMGLGYNQKKLQLSKFHVQSPTFVKLCVFSEGSIASSNTASAEAQGMILSNALQIQMVAPPINTQKVIR